MSKYIVTRTVAYIIEVEADSEDEALDRAGEQAQELDGLVDNRVWSIVTDEIDDVQEA